VPADAGAHFLPRESVGEPFMTPKTVEARRLRICRKLGVRSRAELARKPARQSGKPCPRTPALRRTLRHRAWFGFLLEGARLENETGS